jgi:hypothetical protein
VNVKSSAQTNNSSALLGTTNDKSRNNKWSEQEDLNLSVLVGKTKKTDAFSDFFIMEKQFDLNSMISDFFPDDEK